MKLFRGRMASSHFLVIFLAALRTALGTKDDLEDPSTCSRNRSLFEIPGDAVLSVFLNINHGPYCNVTSDTGLQEVVTASYVVHLLNKYEFIPGFSLGLKILDTCFDETTVYKQALQATVEADCRADRYDMGILLPSEYAGIMEPLRNYSVSPIATYDEENLTRPLINLMVHYMSTRFETVDLLLASHDPALNIFLDAAREAGICVKNYGGSLELEGDETEPVIAVIGRRSDIRQWIERGERLEESRKTWIALSLDGSSVDDLVPSGSYAVRASPLDPELLQDVSSPSTFLEAAAEPVTRSPHLLGVGKAVLELAQLLQDIRKRNCPRATAALCAMQRFNPGSRQEMRNADVYTALRIIARSHSIRYLVAMKSQRGDVVDMAAYNVEPANMKFRVSAESRMPKMPRLCLKKYARNCDGCANFKKRFGPRGKDSLDRGLLKAGNWIPIFLTVVVCGTFACGAIAVFIIYRFMVEDVLDGNPVLTIVLILANVFTLQTVLPFCINDDYLGGERLNSRKILATTLAFGLDFSLMLTRAFFLVFSKGGVFTAHINGHLQGLMVFFMFFVQVAISVMFFALSNHDSAVIMRSLIFIALLGYDIFLLITLFVVCFFIFQLPRNYREGKCFFGTSIGLLIAWAVWLTCFILVEPEYRDTVVSLGIISTAYLIIIGILIPRTYYMVTHLARGKKFGQRFGSTDLAPDSRIDTIGRQSRPFYDYVHSGGGSTTNLHVTPTMYPNYYGSSSPGQKYLGNRRIPGYNNYGYHSEMREVNNSYSIPQVCIEDADSRIDGSATYARPKSNRKRRAKGEKDCIETDVYVESNVSACRRSINESAYASSRSNSPRLAQVEATIREEEEERNEETSRITRF
ncbi:protein bride of sevenless isoform X2 [Apis cerana]|uniref:protein bride of sevenless isoform X2 n=1 Tax=Apis cerana TaxID=7461 RepID=UPI002B222242|nr:protein bride of sevenless isoform X2 [Apis cerana]XP_061941593.1 protein bride of sevenless isoform X2 [Apis cerana]XP_061941595.1 protein bride of sevenless isoform X2 [Apis cerana]